MRFMAGLVFAAIVATGIDLQFVRQLPEFGPVGTLQYDLFLMEVARRTPPGATVAIDVATPKFEPNYAYRYYRAVYYLQGRRVIPLKDPDEQNHPERMEQAEYIAVWATKRTFSHPPIWTGHLGALYRSPH